MITLNASQAAVELARLLGPSRRPCAVALGTFDGVHPGHRRVIDQAREQARQRDIAAVAVTFDPRPERYFRADTALPDLLTLPERVRLLRRHGIDDVVVLPFNDWLAAITPDAFLDALVDELGMRVLCIGEGFRFGAGRTGDVDAALAKGIPAIAVPTVIDPGTRERISSTTLRRKRAGSST